MGFPTANVLPPVGFAVPADGVYAGWLRRHDTGDVLPAAISVGSNPTFDGSQRRVESYVLDRDDLELYGVDVEVSFVARVRGQIRFHGMDALVETHSRAEVDRALANGEKVAVVGYTHTSGAPGCWDIPICTGGLEGMVANPESIFTVDGKYFVYVGADRELLKKLGFRFWDW
jgi:hypothetical protein